MSHPNPDPHLLSNLVQTKLHQALALHQQGQLASAQLMYEDILKMQPLHFHVLHLLGVIALQERDYAKSLDLIDKAIAIEPNLAEAHCNRGIALKELKQYEAAVASFENAIAIKPDFADACCNCGIALKELKQYAAAVAIYDKAIHINPNFAEAYSNRGIALQCLQQLDAAVASCDSAIMINPNFAEAFFNRGLALQEMHQLDAALASYGKATVIKPNYPEAHYQSGNVLQELQRVAAAVISYDNAIATRPQFAEAHCSRGDALRKLRHLEAAVASYDRAIALKPEFAEAYSNRGDALNELQQLNAAIASYDKAINIKPDYLFAHYGRGNALQKLGQLEAATVSFDKTIAIKPDYAIAYSNRLFCLSHSHKVDSQKLRTEHFAFGDQFEAPLRTAWLPHGNIKDPDRCLKVGFVSGDLREHAVASFLEPGLRFLATKKGLSIHAYDTQPADDEVSRRLRTYFAQWNVVADLSDAELANNIRADGIDILFDLSGHTGCNRLLTFARKPAPVQVTWIGYPGTTGLRAMDYILCDRLWMPQEMAWQFTETMAYLPAGMILQPSALAPPVCSLPALTNGYITFGSFNRTSKITSAVIALWASLLRRIPTARMKIGATSPDARAALIQNLASDGIAADRLTFFPRVSAQEYQALHHQFDICLDTFPYGGVTTTAQAGWMGVPTLTLAGDTPSGRYGGSLMNHWGLEMFVAANKEDFVSKGVYWSNHIAELADIRLEMRTRFTASAMGRSELCADAMEAAMRKMWLRWCGGLPPAIIDVTQA